MLVVALHGRGSDESSMLGLADLLPGFVTLVAPRGPVPLEVGFTWFENAGIGRPLEPSIRASAQALLEWLDAVASAYARVVLLGFSGGTAMAGALLFLARERFAGAVLLSGTLPWEVGLDSSPSRFAGLPVFWSIDPDDAVIPAELAVRSHDWLVQQSGARLTERIYPGLGHAIAAEELRDIAAFLEAVPGRA